MKKKMVYISIIVLSIIVYAFAFALIVAYKPSYEYSMYYKKQLTKFWAGDGTMTIGTSKKMLFCYDLNPVDLSTCYAKQTDLQFVGKDTKLKDDDDKLQYVYGNKIDIFWQWNDDTKFDAVTVKIKAKASDYFNVKINNQNDVNVNPYSKDFYVYSFRLQYKKQNQIKFSSNQELQIVEIYFS